MKPGLLLILIACLGLALGIFVRLQNHDAVSQQPTLSFAYPDLEGAMQDVSQWRGKILVVNFWASWCEPCKQEIPEFIRLQQQYADKGVQFVGIALDEREPVQGFLQPLQANYPQLIAGDAGSALVTQLGDVIGILPFTIVVDSHGGIVHRQLGEFSSKDVMALIEPLLPGK